MKGIVSSSVFKEVVRKVALLVSSQVDAWVFSEISVGNSDLTSLCAGVDGVILFLGAFSNWKISGCFFTFLVKAGWRATGIQGDCATLAGGLIGKCETSPSS